MRVREGPEDLSLYEDPGADPESREEEGDAGLDEPAYESIHDLRLVPTGSDHESVLALRPDVVLPPALA